MRIIAVLICVGGCAFGLSGPDPNRPTTTPPQCDTSKGLVTVDAVASVASGLLGLAALSAHDGGLGAGMMATSAVYGASALGGNGRVDRCRAAFHDYEVAMAGVAAERAPALAAKPQDPYEAPAIAAAAPPIPRVKAAAPAPKPAEPAPRPGEPVAQPVKLEQPDAFHVPVGAPPARPVQPKPNPAPPASDDAWRDFWREVP